MAFLWLICLACLVRPALPQALACVREDAQRRPNVVLIIADDLGWDDVSFHGSEQVRTPNIDMLAYTGVTLPRYYTHNTCTPSRAAILTGMFAHTIGMQGYPIVSSEDRAIPLDVKLLPEYMKDLNYSTHLIGKWHVGHARAEYLPINRGFDTHFGFRTGYMDYYEYTSEETTSEGLLSGMCLFRNETPDWSAEGYITDLFTDEAKKIIESHDASRPLFLTVAHSAPHSANDAASLQAPPEDVRAMRHVQFTERRIFAAMVKKLDDSIGEIVKSLSDSNMLENTIIVFVADNGGMPTGKTRNWASNWPLRGSKFTPWEGGIRTVGLVWSMNMNNTSHIWNGYIHASDWVPTLLEAVDAEIPDGINGKNLWYNIVENTESASKEIYEIDDYDGFYSVISGDYKLITGLITSTYSDHLGEEYHGIIGQPPSYTDAIEECSIYQTLQKYNQTLPETYLNIRNELNLNCTNLSFNGCNPSLGNFTCLFNIKDDPCEYNDLSESLPEVVVSLSAILHAEMNNTIPRSPIPVFRDPQANPKYYNNTWDVFL